MAEAQSRQSSPSVKQPGSPPPSSSQTPPPYSAHARSAEIEADIARSRGEMDHTLETLGERLHPRSLLDDAIGAFRNHRGNGQGQSHWQEYAPSRETIHQLGDRAAAKAGRHPIPLALIGSGVAAGLAWLIWEEEGPAPRPAAEPDPAAGETYVDARTGQTYRRDYGKGQGPPGETTTYESFRPSEEEEQRRKERGQPLAGPVAGGGASSRERARAKAGAAVGAAEQKWQHARAKASGGARQGGAQAQAWAEGAGHRIEEAGQHGWGRAKGGARAAEEDVRAGYHRVREEVDEYPLSACLAAAAGGVLLGLLIPASREEDQWMGPAAREIKQQAQADAEEFFERGEQVAASTAQAASDQAEREGIGPDQLEQKAGRVAREAKREGEQQSREQKAAVEKEHQPNQY